MSKIAVVVASRANYARIKSVLRAIEQTENLELQLIVAASALLHRYGNALEVIRGDGFEPAAQVQFLIEGETPTTMAKSTGLAISELATLFENIRPECVMTVADRFETLATAVAASYMNIPLAHTQGGELTGSIDESVRHAITKLAHVHFPATDQSRDRLLWMGEDPEMVHMVGCPAIDLIMDVDLTRSPKEVLANYGGTGVDIDVGSRYLIVLQHPVTTEYPHGAEQIHQTIAALERLHLPTIMLWPNADAGSGEVAKAMREFRENRRPDYVHFYRNFTPEDFLVLMKHCSCMIGNSSSAIREGAFLGTPVVNIGIRQNMRERGRNVIDVEYDADAIVRSVQRQMAVGAHAPDHLYGDGHAGERIADVLSRLDLNQVSVQKTFHDPWQARRERIRKIA